MKFQVTRVKGHGRGKFLGYPTLNLIVPDKFAHEHGIYAGRVWLDEVEYLGAFHYGPVPTFDQPELSLEVFVLDAEINEPSKNIKVELVHRIRDIIGFESSRELIAKISEDVEKVKSLLTIE